MRFLGYFLLVFLAMILLRQVPLIGGLFRVPLFGFFLSAAVVSALVARGGQHLAQRRSFAREARDLGVVDTPQRRGKLGRLLVMKGRAREAVPHLLAALEHDPENVEWRYRLGTAYLQRGEAALAVDALREAVSRDERHAYGDALMQLGLAELAAGDGEAALAALERVERMEGPTPAEMYHKGVILKSIGRKDEARACFARLPELVKQAPKYQKAEARGYAMRAFWAGIL